MRPQKLNKNIASAAIPLGLILLLFWRDLGFTVLVIGVVNYVLHKKKSNWTVI